MRLKLRPCGASQDTGSLKRLTEELSVLTDVERETVCLCGTNWAGIAHAHRELELVVRCERLVCHGSLSL